MRASSLTATGSRVAAALSQLTPQVACIQRGGGSHLRSTIESITQCVQAKTLRAEGQSSEHRRRVGGSTHHDRWAEVLGGSLHSPDTPRQQHERIGGAYLYLQITSSFQISARRAFRPSEALRLSLLPACATLGLPGQQTGLTTAGNGSCLAGRGDYFVREFYRCWFAGEGAMAFSCLEASDAREGQHVAGPCVSPCVRLAAARSRRALCAPTRVVDSNKLVNWANASWIGL